MRGRKGGGIGAFGGRTVLAGNGGGITTVGVGTGLVSAPPIFVSISLMVFSIMISGETLLIVGNSARLTRLQ